LKAAMPHKGLYSLWSQPSLNPCGDSVMKQTEPVDA